MESFKESDAEFNSEIGSVSLTYLLLPLQYNGYVPGEEPLFLSLFK